MRRLKIKLIGTSALLMHSCNGVNPRNPITKKLKEYTGKRKKTEEDLDMISRLEWEQALYYDKDIGLFIPSECVIATLIEGGKNSKKGTDIRKYCSIPSTVTKFDYGDKFKGLDALFNFADGRYVDVRSVRVMRARVNRTRPRFPNWNVEFEMLYEESQIDLDTIKNAFGYAGKYVGLCDNRINGYGRFEVVITELD